MNHHINHEKCIERASALTGANTSNMCSSSQQHHTYEALANVWKKTNIMFSFRYFCSSFTLWRSIFSPFSVELMQQWSGIQLLDWGNVNKKGKKKNSPKWKQQRMLMSIYVLWIYVEIAATNICVLLFILIQNVYMFCFCCYCCEMYIFSSWFETVIFYVHSFLPSSSLLLIIVVRYFCCWCRSSISPHIRFFRFCCISYIM